MADRRRLRVAPRSHLLAVQKFSFPSSKMVWAEFSGDRDNILYSLDDVEDHDESLYAVNPPRSFIEDKRVQQWLFLDLLSAQPVGHDHWTTPRPPFALIALDYTFTGDGDNAKGEFTETIARLEQNPWPPGRWSRCRWSGWCRGRCGRLLSGRTR